MEEPAQRALPHVILQTFLFIASSFYLILIASFYSFYFIFIFSSFYYFNFTLLPTLFIPYIYFLLPPLFIPFVLFLLPPLFSILFFYITLLPPLFYLIFILLYCPTSFSKLSFYCHSSEVFWGVSQVKWFNGWSFRQPIISKGLMSEGTFIGFRKICNRLTEWNSCVSEQEPTG